MFWLGLSLPICFIAGTTGATIPTQYPLLSIVLAPLLWRRGRFTFVHGVGVIFIGYAALSVAWSPNPMFAVWGLWGVALWALSFWMGSTSPSLKQLWRGLALGLALSSLVALVQISGDLIVDINVPPSLDSRPAGLLYNPGVQGMMIALVCVALVCEGEAIWIPPMLPGLLLAQSRGAFLVLCVGLVARYINLMTAIGIMAAAAAVAIAIGGETDALRLADWNFALQHLTVLGYGPASFAQVVIGGLRPEYAHNDFLQLLFEYGAGAVFIFAVIGACLTRYHHPQWPTLVAFCAACCFFFPLYNQPLAFVGAVVAGHLCRGLGRSWPLRAAWRSDLLAWSQDWRCATSEIWRYVVSVSSRNQVEATES